MYFEDSAFSSEGVVSVVNNLDDVEVKSWKTHAHYL